MSESKAHRPTWVEINLDNLAFNFHSVKAFVGKDIKCMAVVKANAYGHGAIESSKRLEAEGVDWFGVALPEEGLELRRAGIKTPILCLGSFWHGQESLLLENDLTAVVYQIAQAELLDRAAGKAGKIANIHVKIDTGMGRIGVRIDELPQFVDKMKQYVNLSLEGVMTHFAAADNLKQNEFTNLQIDRFNKAVAIIQNEGFNPIYLDLANSPGAIAHPESRGNLVRIGGILYGLGGDVLPAGNEKPELKPVLSLHTRIAHLKRVPKGDTLGYGRTFTTKRESIIATIPIGYQDGYPRSLSNRGHAIVNGIFSPVAGRISMDWTILDVTDIPDVKVNDEIILIGEKNGLKISAEEIAAQLGTISYEVTCSIDQRVNRSFISTV